MRRSMSDSSDLFAPRLVVGALFVAVLVTAPALAAGRGGAGAHVFGQSPRAVDQPPGGGGGGSQPTPVTVVRWFESDPRTAPDAVVAGDALDRLSWQLDAPAFPGDVPGSLTATYDSSAPAGLFGVWLPRSIAADESFTAAAAFTIRSDGFVADPDGFFQISWGVWNTQRTGLNRTGNLSDFAADSFELAEFNWFPSVSPLFGGPFLSAALFGDELGGDGFANFTSLFGLSVALPLDTPLLTVLEHRAGADALNVSVYRVIDTETVVPLTGGVGSVPLGFLASRDYSFDALGLTLWQDGFGGPTPALTATLDYELLSLVSGPAPAPAAMFAPGTGECDDDDSSDDDDSDDDDSSSD